MVQTSSLLWRTSSYSKSMSHHQTHHPEQEPGPRSASGRIKQMNMLSGSIISMKTSRPSIHWCRGSALMSYGKKLRHHLHLTFHCNWVMPVNKNVNRIVDEKKFIQQMDLTSHGAEWMWDDEEVLAKNSRKTMSPVTESGHESWFVDSGVTTHVSIKKE